MTPNNTYRLWLAALAVFILAGATGAWMRFGLLYGFPWGLQFINVRHAHSHLMYFGWVTPALMALIVGWLPRLTARPLTSRQNTLFQANILITIIFSLLAFATFLPWGYGLAPIGRYRLPLSTITANLNMLSWYSFAGLYWQATRGVKRIRPLRFWDAALGFMILASLGAWGVALAARFNVQDPFVNVALTQLFLQTFSEGWFVLGVLGAAYAAVPAVGGTALHSWADRSENMLIMGLPVLFLLSVPFSYMPLPVWLIGSAGGGLAALGLAGNITVLWSARPPGWRLPLFFLGLKAVVTLAGTIPALTQWATVAQLRVSYLHWLLLGFVTLGLAAAARQLWGREAAAGYRWLAAAVVGVILSLLLLTSLWPAAWSGRWVRVAAAWMALAPVLAAVFMIWAASRLSLKKQQAAPVT